MILLYRLIESSIDLLYQILQDVIVNNTEITPVIETLSIESLTIETSTIQTSTIEITPAVKIPSPTTRTSTITLPDATAAII